MENEAQLHKSAFLYLDLLHSPNLPLHNHHLRVLSNASRSFWTFSCFSLCANLWLHVHFNTFPVFSPFPFFLFSRSTSSSSPHGRSGCDDIIAWEPAGWGHAGLNAAVCLSVCLVYACRRHARCLCVNDRAALRWLVSSLVAPLTFRFLLLFVHIILVVLLCCTSCLRCPTKLSFRPVIVCGAQALAFLLLGKLPADAGRYPVFIIWFIHSESLWTTL